MSTDNLMVEIVEVLQKSTSLGMEEASFMAALVVGFAFSPLVVRAAMVTRFRAAAEEAAKMLLGLKGKSDDDDNDPSPANSGPSKKEN